MDASWQRYVDESKRFELVLPPDWAVYDGYMGSVVTLAEPPPAGIGFAANVNIVRQSNERKLDAAGLVAESIRAMAVTLTDFVLLERDTDRDEPDLLFAFRQGIYSLTARQRYAVAEDEYWVVTATMRAADYPAKEETLLPVLDSFTLLESWSPSST